jgi:hypothetical protein
VRNMNTRKQLDNIIKKRQVGFEIESTEQGREELKRLFKELERITQGQVKLISTKSLEYEPLEGVTQPTFLIQWLFENDPHDKIW